MRIKCVLHCVLRTLNMEKSWKNRMTTADLRALSPLIYRHVNPYGRFDLDMSKRLPIEADLALLA